MNEDHYDPAIVFYQVIQLAFEKFEETRRSAITELIEYERRLPYSSFSSFKMLEMLLRTDNDVLVFCRAKGLDIISLRLEASTHVSGHFDLTRAQLIAAALPVLLRITRWFLLNDGSKGSIGVPSVGPIKEQLANEWKEKIKIATLIIDSFLIERPVDALKPLSHRQPNKITPHISENETPAFVYEVLMNLCQIDNNCLVEVFKRLHNDHSLLFSNSVSRPKLSFLLRPSPSPSSSSSSSSSSPVPFSELQRYYHFVLSLSTLSFQRLCDQPSDVQRTVNQSLSFFLSFCVFVHADDRDAQC